MSRKTAQTGAFHDVVTYYLIVAGIPQRTDNCLRHFSAKSLSHRLQGNQGSAMLKHYRMAFAVALLTAISCDAGAAAKDESRLLPQQLAQDSSPVSPLPLPGSETPAAGATGETPPASGQGEDLTEPDPNAPTGDDGISPDDMSLGEIPVVESMELTVDIAKRAIDSYVLVKAKYESAGLEQYESLQDFVDQGSQGKEFDADIKAAGFASVNDWNLAITSLGFAYSALSDDPTADIKQQIAEIETDTTIAQDMKDRMVKSLNAMIPSDNNRKVVDELMKDPAYAEKLKQLDTEEE